MAQTFVQVQKAAKINAFVGVRSAHRYQGIAFFDEELDLLNRAIRLKGDRMKGFGDSARMKGRPKGECGKVRYRSRKDALQALKRVKAHRDRQIQYGWQLAKVESRVYRCPKCAHGYHLTSRPLFGSQSPAPVIHLRKSLHASELAKVFSNVA